MKRACSTRVWNESGRERVRREIGQGRQEIMQRSKLAGRSERALPSRNRVEIDHEAIGKRCAEHRHNGRCPHAAARAGHRDHDSLTSWSAIDGGRAQDRSRQTIGFFGPADQLARARCERCARSANRIVRREGDQRLLDMARRDQRFTSGDHDVACARRVQGRRRDEQPGDRFEHAGDLLDHGTIVVRDDDAETLGGHATSTSDLKGEAAGRRCYECDATRTTDNARFIGMKSNLSLRLAHAVAQRRQRERHRHGSQRGDGDEPFRDIGENPAPE
jgi:hypothetical protein